MVSKYGFKKEVLWSLWKYRGADTSFARSGRKQAIVTEDFDVHISYLLL